MNRLARAQARNLFNKPIPPSLLTQVEDHAAPLGSNCGHCRSELGAAVAALTEHGVAGEAFAVDSYQLHRHHIVAANAQARQTHGDAIGQRSQLAVGNTLDLRDECPCVVEREQAECGNDDQGEYVGPRITPELRHDESPPSWSMKQLKAGRYRPSVDVRSHSA
jgi:hypothetical protein